MALDPRIALESTVPTLANSAYAGETAGINNANTLQNMAATRQNIEMSKAQQVGVEADSAAKQRALEFNTWAKENRSKFVDKDGKIDAQQFVNNAAAAGFVTEAQSAAAADVDILGKQVTQSKDQQEMMLKKQEFGAKTLNHIVTLLQATPPEKRAEMAAQYAKFTDGYVPGTSQIVMDALGVQQPVTDANGRPVMTTDPTTGQQVPQTKVVIDDKKIQALATATMTTKEQGEMKINQQIANTGTKQAETSAFQARTDAERVAQGGQLTFTSPEYRDPKSAASRLVREAARAGGVQGVTDEMKGSEVANLPGFNSQMLSGTIPTEVRANAVVQATEARRKANETNIALKLINKLDIPNGTKVLSFIANKANQFVNTPEYAALQSALTQYKAEHPDVNLDGLDKESMAAILRGQQDIHNSAAKTYSGLAKGSTFNQVTRESDKEPSAPTRKYKVGEIVDGRLVMSRSQADAAPKGTKFKGTDGVNYTK